MADPRLPIPDDVARNAAYYFGDRGVTWLRDLPQIVERLAERWSLALGPHFPNLSINYVAPARRADGTACVLKVGVPNDELRLEIESLGHWDGRGIARRLEADPNAGAILLERLEPGTRLTELATADDDAATRVGAAVMRGLWRPRPEHHCLWDLTRWFRSLLDHREQHGGPGRFPARLIDQAEEVARDLIASTGSPVMLHGDLHHFNILRAERAPWLAIDPKGLVGDHGFELSAFLRNPRPSPAAVLSRRLDILTDELALDRRRARDWCFAEAMLNASWSHDDPEETFRRKVDWAELMLTL